MINFLGQEIVEGKRYVYLKRARTVSSTTRKLKMIGECVGSRERLEFLRLWCEPCKWSGPSKEKDIVYNAEDVICEYVPTEEQWKKKLPGDG